MKLLPPEPTVDLYNDGFDDPDILDRKKTGKALSALLDRFNDPVVVALDGRWGTGKTYFLKRWVGAHTNQNQSNATTVYFDAFANDYLSDPLPALVSALIERLPAGNETKIKKVKEAVYKLAKPLARVGLAVATFGAKKELNDFGDAIVEALGDETSEAFKNYWKKEDGRRSAMAEFKGALEALVSPVDGENSKPLAIVIDELDRCRPDYALELLEVIKHFFSVPHVHFVLGVNLEALENSVKVRYGNGIDAQAYLKKFIQISLELPEEIGNIHLRKPVNYEYLDYLTREMGLPDHISNLLTDQIRFASRQNHVTLRDIGKIVSAICLASEELISGTKIYGNFVIITIDLVIAKIIRPDLFTKLLRCTITEKELVEYFGATDEFILEKNGEADNPKFDNSLRWNFLLWIFVANNGKHQDIPEGWEDSFRQGFGHSFRRSEMKTMPYYAYNKYLNQFSFYND